METSCLSPSKSEDTSPALAWGSEPRRLGSLPQNYTYTQGGRVGTHTLLAGHGQRVSASQCLVKPFCLLVTTPPHPQAVTTKP